MGEGLFLSLFSYALQEEERAGCFIFIVLRTSGYCKCSVALSHGAMGWSAVCDSVFPDHTHLRVHPASRLNITMLSL